MKILIFRFVSRSEITVSSKLCFEYKNQKISRQLQIHLRISLEECATMDSRNKKINFRMDRRKETTNKNFRKKYSWQFPNNESLLGKNGHPIDQRRISCRTISAESHTTLYVLHCHLHIILGLEITYCCKMAKTIPIQKKIHSLNRESWNNK